MQRSFLKRKMAIGLALFSSILILSIYSFAQEPPPLPQILTVRGYCQLNILLLQKNVESLQSKIDVLHWQQDDPEMFLELEENINNLEKVWQDSVFGEFNTNGKAYIEFAIAHKAHIARYLEANPEINQQIQDLLSQRESLAQEFEYLLVSYGIRGEE